MYKNWSFSKTLQLFSVPARYPEAFGLYVVEAMAAGVPVVLPNDGSFPEIIEATQGGYLYDPKEDGGLIRALEHALCEPEKAKKWDCRGIIR